MNSWMKVFCHFWSDPAQGYGEGGGKELII